jgi:hypothetical protein
MGADITAFLQIDDNTRPNDPASTNDPSTWDMSHDYGLSSGKHYEFVAAISGVRNESCVSPLFPCRGLPPTGLRDLRERIDAADPNVSWLTLSEIRQALQHMKIEAESLKRPIQMLLRTMQTAEDLYGRDRVRLVFAVSD